MNSTYDVISAYQLRQDVLENYLQDLFPNDAVEVAVSHYRTSTLFLPRPVSLRMYGLFSVRQ